MKTITLRGITYTIKNNNGAIKLDAGYTTFPVNKLRKAEKELLNKILGK